jgi:hypothetical protein
MCVTGWEATSIPAISRIETPKGEVRTMTKAKDGGGHWNRAGRRSGGDRPFHVRGLGIGTREDGIILAQREAIRREFGEEGVKRFDEELEKKAARESSEARKA